VLVLSRIEEFHQQIKKQKAYFKAYLITEHLLPQKQKLEQMYNEFQNDQEEFEEERTEIINNLGDCYNFISVLKNMPLLEEPRLFDQQQLVEEEHEAIQKLYEKKMKSLENKYINN
jgi:hypothetical protein